MILKTLNPTKKEHNTPSGILNALKLYHTLYQKSSSQII